MAKCKLGEVFADVDNPPESDALFNAVWDKDARGNYVWSAVKLSQAINKTRYSVGKTTIKDHRNTVCGCGK